jgi:hypothetical protein
MPDGQKYEVWLKSKGSGEDGENAGASQSTSPKRFHAYPRNGRSAIARSSGRGDVLQGEVMLHAEFRECLLCLEGWMDRLEALSTLVVPHDASGVLSSSTLRSHTVPGPATTRLSLMRSGF